MPARCEGGLGCVIGLRAVSEPCHAAASACERARVFPLLGKRFIARGHEWGRARATSRSPRPAYPGATCRLADASEAQIGLVSGAGIEPATI